MTRTVGIAELRVGGRGARTFVEDPGARIEATAGVDAVAFSGTSVLLVDDGAVGELGLVVTGELIGGGGP